MYQLSLPFGWSAFSHETIRNVIDKSGMIHRRIFSEYAKSSAPNFKHWLYANRGYRNDLENRYIELLIAKIEYEDSTRQKVSLKQMWMTMVDREVD